MFYIFNITTHSFRKGTMILHFRNLKSEQWEQNSSIFTDKESYQPDKLNIAQSFAGAICWWYRIDMCLTFLEVLNTSAIITSVAAFVAGYVHSINTVLALHRSVMS